MSVRCLIIKHVQVSLFKCVIWKLCRVKIMCTSKHLCMYDCFDVCMHAYTRALSKRVSGRKKATACETFQSASDTVLCTCNLVFTDKICLGLRGFAAAALTEAFQVASFRCAHPRSGWSRAWWEDAACSTGGRKEQRMMFSQRTFLDGRHAEPPFPILL